MLTSNRKLGFGISIVIAYLMFTFAAESQTKRRFTVADDIGLSKFIPVAGSEAGPVQFSPDGRYFVAVTERGLVDSNQLESSIWLWRTSDAHEFLRQDHVEAAPNPVCLIRLAAAKGPVIKRVRWLEDSSALAFVGPSPKGNNQVFQADVRSAVVHALTPDDQDVVDYDVRNGNIAYVVRNLEAVASGKRNGPAFVTGKTLYELLFPDDRFPERIRDTTNRVYLWAIINGKRFQVEDPRTHEPFQLYQWGADYDPATMFALSPDGQSAVLVRALEEPPARWVEYKYRPDVHMSQKYRQEQDLNKLNDADYVKTYFLLTLSTGELKQLIDAPEASYRVWYGARTPRWSGDGRRVLLPNTFLPFAGAKSDGQEQRKQRPCLSVFDLPTQKIECLVPLKAESEGGSEIRYANFSSPDGKKMLVRYEEKNIEFRETESGSWVEDKLPESEANFDQSGLGIEVKQSLNNPPVLSVKDRSTKQERALWDPNPQLKDISLGEASILNWKDKTGHPWEAGLFKPPDFKKGVRYPLVIQTHGFFGNDYFVSYGSIATGFAARELAGAGFLVVQMPDDLKGVVSTPQEATRHIAGFESVVEKLDAEGIIDRQRVGLVGFSRTCYYVLAALTTGKIKYAAASFTDGVTYGYWQYLLSVDSAFRDADFVVGASPFGVGLKQWMARSPEFNLYKVSAPVLIGTQGPEVTLAQWGEYAVLHSLKRPVELLDLGGENYEHVLTSPAKRLASQGSTVDWFRFWLKGEEDPDPNKAEQYRRWRDLRTARQQDHLN